MRDAELLPDLPQVARCATLVLHHAGAADHFEVRNFAEVGQNFVLRAVAELRVLFVIAEFSYRTMAMLLFGMVPKDLNNHLRRISKSNNRC